MESLLNQVMYDEILAAFPETTQIDDNDDGGNEILL